MRPFVPALALAWLVLSPSAASAQLDTGERVDRRGHRLAIELGGAERREGPFGRPLFPRAYEPPAGVPSPSLEPPAFPAALLAIHARARLQGEDAPVAEDGSALTVDVELAWRAIVTGDGVARAGNPLISGALGWRRRDLALRVALGVGAPLSHAYDREIDEPRTYSLFRASQGRADAWLATEEAIPFVLRARVEGIAGVLFAGGDLAGAVMPTLPRGGERTSAFVSTDDLLLAAQVGAWIGGRIEEIVAIGARAQLVVHDGVELEPYGFGYPPSVDPPGEFGVYRGPWHVPDRVEAYVSAIAFVRLELDELELEGRLLLNLDEPYGIGFDEGATWAATLGAAWAP